MMKIKKMLSFGLMGSLLAGGIYFWHYKDYTKIIETKVIIRASPQSVWSVLTKFDDYPSWNPFILSIEGTKRVGEALKITVQSPGSSPMSFLPIVLSDEEQKAFRWKGKFFIEGLFDGEHSFNLQDNHDKTVTFIHKEVFTGALVKALPFLLERTEQGFILMNNALKKRCEQA